MKTIFDSAWSLGKNCDLPLNLLHYGFPAGPLDYMVAPLESLPLLINNHFNDFMKREKQPYYKRFHTIKDSLSQVLSLYDLQE